MAVKNLHQFFYYHNKYLNSMKCQEISMDPSKCTIQCTLQEYLRSQPSSYLLYQVQNLSKISVI
jgi:hypothetical protein